MKRPILPTLLLLVVACQSTNSAPTIEALQVSKEVRWRTASGVIEYSVVISRATGSAVEIDLSIHNAAGTPIYVLDSQPWDVSTERRNVSLSWGTRTFLYGSELPQMRRLDQGSTVSHRSAVKLPLPLDEVNFLTVGFYCLCEIGDSLDDRLTHLEAIDGWWQDADAPLAEEFLNHLVLEEVVFYNIPLKP